MVGGVLRRVQAVAPPVPYPYPVHNYNPFKFVRERFLGLMGGGAGAAPEGSEGRRGRWGTPTMTLHIRIQHREYRGTSPTRKRLPPYDTLTTLGIGLR